MEGARLQPPCVLCPSFPPPTPRRPLLRCVCVLRCRTLGALAEKCHAYAKALHYKELEFQSSPHTAVEALISINNQLRQPDAAVGILNVAQKELHMDLKESWCVRVLRGGCVRAGSVWAVHGLAVCGWAGYVQEEWAGQGSAAQCTERCTA